MNASDAIVLDFSRSERIGIEEAVLCSGKATTHLVEILRQVDVAARRILLTRLSERQFGELPSDQQCRLDFDPLSRTAYFPEAHRELNRHRVAVVSAGTSDVPVAREAARTLCYFGEVPLEIADVGVAGLWRLLERLTEIRDSSIVIAVAGMDAALPTVLAGLIQSPVIGVPTSVGYGVSEGGQTALKAMLASCAPGLMVTNIDNGFGAACGALKILRRFGETRT